MIFKKNHQLSTKYIFNRLKQMYFQKNNQDAPWLTKESILLLEHLLKDSDIGLEFGSGRSTKWLAKRCHSLYSVENHSGWFEKVSVELEDFKNVKYRFRQVDQNDPSSSGYLDILDELSANSIDFILNDGKLRGLVALKSIKKLKPGGLFILDDAERYISNLFDIHASIGTDKKNMTQDWVKFWKDCRSWRRIWTTDGVSSTLILFKQ